MPQTTAQCETAARFYLKSLTEKFGGGGDADRAVTDLLRVAPPAEFAAGATVAREGEPSDGAFFVVEGRLRATLRADKAEASASHTLNEALPGELIGETGIFLSGGHRMADIVAAERSTVLVMKRDLFRTSPDNPALIALEQHVLRTLARRIANTDALIERAWREAGAGGRSVREGLLAYYGQLR